MRTIGVVTVGRSDYGILRPVLAAIAADPSLAPALYVSGAHVSSEHDTIRDIEADGFPVAATFGMLPSSASAASVAEAMGKGVSAFADVFSRKRPDLLLLLGDRFEMFAAAAAAVPFLIPLGHIHGGEITEGAIDESFRHAMTKMSHLHFVSTEAHARRVRQMGEEAWRVTVSGAPALDQVRSIGVMTREELETRVGMPLDQPPLLVTFHPVTLDPGGAAGQIAELLAAIRASGYPAVLTYPNVDAEHDAILAALRAYVDGAPRARLVANLGTRGYFSLMAHAAAMVGNSSSGIIEAASFGVPVVNVGDRQAGRFHGQNVLDVPCERAAIEQAIRTATAPQFRAGFAGAANPYGDGHASERIAGVLRSTPLDRRLLAKRFADIEACS